VPSSVQASRLRVIDSGGNSIRIQVKTERTLNQEMDGADLLTNTKREF